jgi:CheY-like chemotaxis protein
MEAMSSDQADEPQQSQLDVVLGTLTGTLKVLVADDDEQMLDLVSSVLTVCPLFSVTAVASARRARSLASAGGWHCLLFDLYVPEIADGLGLARDFAPDTPVVMLSGRSTGEEGYRCSQYNVADFLDKGDIHAAVIRATVLRHALLKLLFLGYPFARDNLSGRQMAATLVENLPESVAQWAELQGVSPRALEQRSLDCGGFRPRTVLALFRLYRLAFEHLDHPRPARLVGETDRVLLGRYASRRTVLSALIAERREPADD